MREGVRQGLDILQTGVLVVGAGGAALRAAVEARRAGANVLLVTKGRLGKSGASSTAARITAVGGYNVANGLVDPEDSPLEHYRDIMVAADGTCDPKLARILAHEAPDTLHDLEQMGVPFVKQDGRHVVCQGCFASRPRMHLIQGHAAPIVAALAKEALALGVRVIEEAMITDFAVDGDECCGALILSADGTVTAVHAGAVVLATGGGGSLFALNFNPPDVTADGYAMALRAGADLINMEFMQGGPGLVYPVRGELESWVWALRPRLYNAQHEEFLQEYAGEAGSPAEVMEARAAHYPFSGTAISRYLDIAIKREVEAGRGTPRRGVYLDFTQVDLDQLPDTPRGDEIRQLWPITVAWFAERGVDLKSQPVEVAIFGHALNGGLRIDEKCETTLPGLFAAGETAGGPHGADRLGGNMILACQVFGRRAGIFAAARAAERSTSPPPSAFDAPLARIERLRAQRGDLTPHEVKKHLRESAWQGLLINRSEAQLHTFLTEMEELDGEATRVNAPAPRDLQQLLEIENLNLTARVIGEAAMRREESRGSHYREDFPEKDDTNWRQSLICRYDGKNLLFRSLRFPGE